MFIHSTPAIIGGPGVEIDESKFAKCKYNCGRMVEGHWVLEEWKEFQGSAFWSK